MWVVHNNTPLAVDRGFVRDRQGGEVWIAIIRGTFDVRQDGELHVAADQVPPIRAAEWSGEPGLSSLLYDTDFVLASRGTDVLVHGHACAPGGRPVPSVEVGLRVGPLSKRLRVNGVRAWMTSYVSSAVVPGPPRPFTKLPITYENAFGGTDTSGPKNAPQCCAHNPVGTGFTHQPKRLIGLAAPHVERLDAAIKAGPHEQPSAGLGPVAPAWLPRASWAGTYDAAWAAERAPLLPVDFDERFYRSAPPDQQLPSHLPAKQLIELYNLTPEGYWRVRIPTLAFHMRTIFTDGEARTDAVLHTVLLEPERRRAQVVWHLSLPCQGREHKLTSAIIDWEGERSCLSP
jgi:hypothetical protein